MIKYIIIITLLFSFFCVAAQQTKEEKLVQFSGVIQDVDSNSVVPYVVLHNITANKSYLANYKGYFSFVVNEGDSILFSSIGYKQMSIIIPKNVKDSKYTTVVKIKSEVINLPMVRVFPWASLDEFKHDFLTMKLADDDLEIAKKNVKKATLNDFTYSLPRDGQEIRGMNFNNQHIGLSNKNMVQTNPLLNPLAWGAFIKQLTDKKTADK